MSGVKVSSRIEWNARELDGYLVSNPGVLRATRAEAERLKGILEGLAAAVPYKTENRSGRYESSFTIEPVRVPSRQTFRVYAAVPYATKLERLYGVFTRGLASAAG